MAEVAPDAGPLVTGPWLVRLRWAAVLAQARATAAAPISIRFAATVGETPFSCTGKFAGIGTIASTIQVTDFRFFASNVRLVRADGAEVPVKLTEDGLQGARIGQRGEDAVAMGERVGERFHEFGLGRLLLVVVPLFMSPCTATPWGLLSASRRCAHVL